jgi:hypothetical protein
VGQLLHILALLGRLERMAFVRLRRPCAKAAHAVAARVRLVERISNRRLDIPNAVREA